MSEFDDKLSAILNDSNAMGQIMALAQSLSGPKQAGDEEEGCGEPEGAEEPPEMPGFPAGLFDDGKDAQLLAALRPYLRAERQKKLDKTLELLRLLRLLKSSRL